jgi:predicted N-acetyltransferase YhbS
MPDDASPSPPPRLFAAYEPRATDAPREAAPSQIVYGSATPADADGIARLIALREGFTHAQAMERPLRFLHLPAETNWSAVARIDGMIVGFGRAGHVQVEGAPVGWYLNGVIVDERFRRRGIGLELTHRRLKWIGQHADEAYFFVNSLNLASIDLHARLGFQEIRRPFEFPGAHFSGGGVGVLFRADRINLLA